MGARWLPPGKRCSLGDVGVVDAEQTMTEERARGILGDWITEDGKIDSAGQGKPPGWVPSSSNGLSSAALGYAAFRDRPVIRLHGDFTADMLEAMAWVMRQRLGREGELTNGRSC